MCPEAGQMLGCRKHTLMSACFFFNACRSVVGGLLLRGISKSVVTPPTAAADVAAKMPAPTDVKAFAGVQACGLRALTSLAVCTGPYSGHLPDSIGATGAAQSLMQTAWHKHKAVLLNQRHARFGNGYRRRKLLGRKWLASCSMKSKWMGRSNWPYAQCNTERPGACQTVPSQCSRPGSSIWTCMSTSPGDTTASP